MRTVFYRRTSMFVLFYYDESRRERSERNTLSVSFSFAGVTRATADHVCQVFVLFRLSLGPRRLSSHEFSPRSPLTPSVFCQTYRTISKSPLSEFSHRFISSSSSSLLSLSSLIDFIAEHSYVYVSTFLSRLSLYRALQTPRMAMLQFSLTVHTVSKY